MTAEDRYFCYTNKDFLHPWRPVSRVIIPSSFARFPVTTLLTIFSPLTVPLQDARAERCPPKKLQVQDDVSKDEYNSGSLTGLMNFEVEGHNGAQAMSHSEAKEKVIKITTKTAKLADQPGLTSADRDTAVEDAKKRAVQFYELHYEQGEKVSDHDPSKYRAPQMVRDHLETDN